MSKKLIRLRNEIIVSLLVFICGTAMGGNVKLGFYIAAYLLVGYSVIKKAAVNIAHGQIFDENFLMMLATFGAFFTGEYPEAVMVMWLYQVGELFQGYAVGKSRDSIKSLLAILPEYANLKKGDEIIKVDPEEVEIGDVIVVKPGEKVPLDGRVIEGRANLNTAALTGESLPRTVAKGEEILSGCIDMDGLLVVEVTKIYEDSTVAKIMELVENAGNRKAKTENFITKFARYYTPFVVILALLLAFIPPLFGGDIYDYVYRSCAFLVISCPCALVISVPLSFFGGIGSASKKGILVKGSNYLEILANTQTMVFDKTGTLTKGSFKVTATSQNRSEVLYWAAIAEKLSNHPIAKAIEAETETAIDLNRLAIKEIAGKGVIADYDGHRIIAGNEELLQSEMVETEALNEEGTIVYVAVDGHYLGYVAVSDTVKEEASVLINGLKQKKIKTVMLTGDKHEVAQRIGRELNIDRVCFELLPQDKVNELEKIIKENSDNVAFVGDGINDAPVLKRADVGIAMGAMGSDAAIEASDIVIMDDDLEKILTVRKIADKTMTIVKENIVFAIGIKLLVLVLGAFGIANMWEAIFSDVGVAFIAILNAMRTLKI